MYTISRATLCAIAAVLASAGAQAQTGGASTTGAPAAGAASHFAPMAPGVVRPGIATRGGVASGAEQESRQGQGASPSPNAPQGPIVVDRPLYGPKPR